ncbi:MAG: sugar phosphate nucleotidyltransferase [Acidobacteriota bacterium]
MDESIVGLLPAAGRARRLGELPCSKEVLPVGFEADGRPRPVARHLLEGWASSGIERALIVLRPEKWDVAAALGDGADLGLDLAYLTVGDTASVPETLDRARTWLGDASVALGFPDILLEPRDAWTRLVAAHRASRADVTLGCVPTDQPWKTDMVDLDAAGRLLDVVIKQRDCALRWTWSFALWRPSFTAYLGKFLARPDASRHDAQASTPELYVGDVLRAAARDGLDLRGVCFEEGSFLDVGTPDDLRRAIHAQSRVREEPLDDLV